MRVLRLHAVGDVRLADEPVPDPGPGEELVRVTAVGLCGSDLHWYAEGGIGDAKLSRPIVPGHEFAGVISGGPRDGVRVAVDPAIPCEHCDMCRRGWGNLCPTVRFAGHGTTDGALREYLTWPADLLTPLPESISDVDGAMLEPLGVALHALDLGHVHLGGSVAVIGCGPIGLMVIQAARLAGATTVLAVEPLPHRAEAAARFGATVVDPANVYAAGPGGLGVDVAFEVGGTDDAVDSAIAAARPGGRVVLVGIPDNDRTTFQAGPARRKGLTIALARRMHAAYPRAARLTDQKLIDITSVVTDRYPLERGAEAFQAGVDRRGLKVVIEP